MKAILYVFSGTGNTRLIAEQYQAALDLYEVRIFDVQHLQSHPEIPNPHDYELVGFGYPVHGFNAPKIMVDFCRSLPRSGAKKTAAFIFKSSGEGLSFNRYSSQKMIRILEKKGFRFLLERHYVMPYNMIFRHTPEMVKSEWLYAKAMVRLNAAEIQNGKTENVHTNPFKGWFVPFIRVEWLYAQLQGPAMRVDLKKCVRCMKCVESCPYDNITYTGTSFKFGMKCALCVRCSFNCPACAISIGLLNKWRINGSYNIKKTAADPLVPFPYFTQELRGVKRWLYYKYYRACDAALAAAGMSVQEDE
ncbi:MAG: EFR1 family ferrodoxin [Treponema sp.]|nr:EFR1 family ferrodoxin [Treponema sp.]